MGERVGGWKERREVQKMEDTLFRAELCRFLTTFQLHNYDLMISDLGKCTRHHIPPEM